MPQKESAKQNVKININLGEKKKPRKPRGKRKPKAKIYPTAVGSFAGSGQYRNPAVSRQDIPQSQFLPVYINQYPTSLNPQNAGYMNSGIPNNPQRLLTYGSPTTALTRMNTPANFQRQPARRRTNPSGPQIQQYYQDEMGNYIPYMTQNEAIAEGYRGMFADPETEELNFANARFREPRDVDDNASVISDISELSGPPTAYSTMTPSTEYSSDFSSLSTGERNRTMINQIGQNRIQPNPNIPRWDEEWNEGNEELPMADRIFRQEDDEDDGFFSTNGEPPALEEINFA